MKRLGPYLKFCTAMMAVMSLQQVTAAAETACKSEVSFKWKKDKEELTEFWSTLQAKGADDKAAKESIARAFDRERVLAQKSCRERHEDVSGCIAGKLSALRPALSSMGFSERKSVETAVSADCTAQQGVCSDVVMGEPKCVEMAAAEAAGKATEEKGGKKEEKGKKK